MEAKLDGDVRPLHDPVEDQEFDPFEIGHRGPSIKCEEDFDDRFDEVDGEELFDSYRAVLTTEVAAGLTSSCAKERIALRKHSSFLRLFPAQKPLEFVAIDIL